VLPSIVTSTVCASAFRVTGVFPIIEKLVPEIQKEAFRTRDYLKSYDTYH
jgi:hypothetical protein